MPIAVGQPDTLIGLALAQFPRLSEAERRLLRAAPRGEMAWCGPSPFDTDVANDPNGTQEWGAERSIHGVLLRWLCVDGRAKNLVDPKGVLVHAARVVGAIDISNVTVPFPLALKQCRLTDDFILLGAEIPQLSMEACSVQRIHGDDAKFKSGLFLCKGFRADGIVAVRGAQINGSFDCHGGTFRSNPGDKERFDAGVALDASEITVKGDVFLNGQFVANGEVRIVGARIDQDLDCGTARLEQPHLEETSGGSWASLNADGVVVGNNTFLGDGFFAAGDVRFYGAQVAGSLICVSGTFNKLNARAATIRGTFMWSGIANAQSAQLILTDANIGSINDEERSWPNHGRLNLDGFIYARITNGPTEAEERLKWLRLQDPFTPQPYRQLAKVLAEAGDDRGSRAVLMEMESALRKGDPYWAVPANLLEWTVGYGYAPERVFIPLIVFFGLGWVIYRRAMLAGRMVPTDRGAYEHFKRHSSSPPHYEAFCSGIYSLENSLPLVNLGQADLWQPDPSPFAIQKGRVWRRITSPGWLRGYRRFQIIVGWIIATLLVAGLTGIIRR